MHLYLGELTASYRYTHVRITMVVPGIQLVSRKQISNALGDVTPVLLAQCCIFSQKNIVHTDLWVSFVHIQTIQTSTELRHIL